MLRLDGIRRLLAQDGVISCKGGLQYFPIIKHINISSVISIFLRVQLQCKNHGILSLMSYYSAGRLLFKGYKRQVVRLRIDLLSLFKSLIYR